MDIARLETQTGPPIVTPANTAQARSRAYALFARVLVAGPSPETVSLLRQLPTLSGYLPDDVSLDPCAAEHHRLFGLEVYPYAGVFTSDEALIGQTATDLTQVYARAGFTPTLRDVSPDHLGVQFSFLSFLAGAEADALEDGVTDASAHLQGLQRSFLDQHLLMWLPPMLAAIRQQRSSVWTQLVELGAELASDQRQQLAGDSAIVTPAASKVPDLTQEGTSLDHIVSYLLAPKASGVMLSRGAIVALGRSDELPSGFGSRAVTLRNLIFSAAKYDAWPRLLHELVALVKVHATVYAELAKNAYMAPSAHWWQQRTAATITMLQAMNDMQHDSAIFSGAVSASDQATIAMPPGPLNAKE